MLDLHKPLFGNKHTSLQKILADANKTTETPIVPCLARVPHVAIYT